MKVRLPVEVHNHCLFGFKSVSLSSSSSSFRASVSVALSGPMWFNPSSRSGESYPSCWPQAQSGKFKA